MNEKPTIQIVLPVMPDPERFKGLGHKSSNDAGLFQMALTSWEKVCQLAIEKGCQLDLNTATEVPVTIVNDGTKH